MTLADTYRFTARGLKERADSQSDVGLRPEFESLAQKYFLLAELAERNCSNDVVYETPPLP
jgi:hypothetical protein